MARMRVRRLHSVQAELLAKSREAALAARLAQYPELLVSACEELSPHAVAFYLRDLASELHGYYNAERFLVDDAAVREVLDQYLRSVGYRTRSFDCAETVLQNLEWCTTAACMVVDVRMGAMDGIQLLEIIHREVPALPVIIMTGHGDIPMAVEAIKLGAFHFLEKPLDPEQLAKAIATAITSKQKSGEIESKKREARQRLEKLTDRQREILLHIAKGQTSKEVAAVLGLVVLGGRAVVGRWVAATGSMGAKCS